LRPAHAGTKEAGVFAKVATVVVVLGAMFGALLVNRQQRVDAAAEIGRSHVRITRHERARVKLQADVASAVRPDRLRERIAALPGGLEAFRPIPFRYDPADADEKALGALAPIVAVGHSPDGPDARYGG
jgi:hypothetical protein